MEGGPESNIRRRLHMTPRQQQILELVAAGFSDKQIASKLRVSPRTVQSHLDRFFIEHGIHKRAAAVAFLLLLKESRSQNILPADGR
ncbi:MAG: helix-turn-helix transcriptional regulator [Chloroflexi bacterium]|nr:MAG: helix-turn-helix transcriptional regulator [Chloroflexota bacterium]TMB96077.1 MAG: helix-turn-helix transcriptional regulator [Chloroflexota bacterium]